MTSPGIFESNYDTNPTFSVKADSPAVFTLHNTGFATVSRGVGTRAMVRAGVRLVKTKNCFINLPPHVARSFSSASEVRSGVSLPSWLESKVQRILILCRQFSVMRLECTAVAVVKRMSAGDDLTVHGMAHDRQELALERELSRDVTVFSCCPLANGV